MSASGEMPALEHHTAQVKDVRLHYVTAGAGDPVVLLHGWPQTWASWRAVIAPLAERYTVIVPDLRGMGATSKPDAGYDTNNVADDIHELVRSLGHEAILLAGHDWGGATAYAYAAQFRDEVRRLAIFEMVLPGFGMMEGAMVPQPGGQFLWHMGWQSVPDMPLALLQGREDIYLRWFFDTYAYDPSAVDAAAADEYVRSMTHIGALRAGLEYYKQFFVSAAQNRVHAERKLTIPTMGWAGEACLGPLTKECLELAAEDVRGGVIERCGHWIGEERPDFVAERLLEFFGENAGG
jgi:pimeloyl-ACP methyl ester carboxylesterase